MDAVGKSDKSYVSLRDKRYKIDNRQHAFFSCQHIAASCRSFTIHWLQIISMIDPYGRHSHNSNTKFFRSFSQLYTPGLFNRREKITRIILPPHKTNSPFFIAFIAKKATIDTCPISLTTKTGIMHRADAMTYS